MQSTVMEFNVESAGPCRKRVSVSIPKERVSEEFDKSYRHWIQSVPIPGFRPGKAPRKLVEKRFGEQVALEVKQTLMDAAFEQALKKNDLAPIAEPELKLDEIEVAPEQSMAFDFTVTVKPEIALPDLKEIEVTVPGARPVQAEIDAALDNLRKRKATLRPVKQGTIETGDVVTLKARGKSGEQERMREDDLPYEVGSNWLGGLIAQGLDQALLGKSVGDSVKATLLAPPHAENHPLAGEVLELEAEILDHKRPDLPALDDDLARAFDFDSRSELMEAVQQDVAAHRQRERNREIEDLALAQLIEKCDFDLPKELIEREVEDLARRAAYEFQLQGKSEQEIAQKVAEVRARRAEDSARELKLYFILDKIVEKERILVTETEVREAVASIAAYHGKPPDEMYAALRESGRLGSLRNQLRERKARAKLRSRSRVKDAPADRKEGANPTQDTPDTPTTEEER